MGNEETDPRPPAWAGVFRGCTLGAPSSGPSLVGLLASRARLRFTASPTGAGLALAAGRQQGVRPGAAVRRGGVAPQLRGGQLPPDRLQADGPLLGAMTT